MKEVDVIMLSYTKGTVNNINIRKRITQSIYEMTKTAIQSLRESENDFKFNVYLVETNNNFHSEYPLGYNANVIIPNIPFNYNKFINIGLKSCKNDYVVMTNNDVVFGKNWFSIIKSAMEENNSYSACPYYMESDEIPDICEGYEGNKQVLGYCIVAKKEVIDSIGEFDERFDFCYQDFDYAMQLKEKGFRHILVKKSIVRHLGQKSHHLLVNAEHSTSGLKKTYDEKYRK